MGPAGAEGVEFRAWARATPKGLPPRSGLPTWSGPSAACTRRRRPDRPAVYGSTDDEPERHFLGWLDEVDPDELFATGRAWGLKVVRRRES